MRTNVEQFEAAPERPRRGRSLNALALQLSAVALAFILVALLVVTSSQAAFVAQNDNTTNQVSSASIDLADNDEAAAMFQNVTGLMPAVDEERCIRVTYTGNVDPAAVKLYRSGVPTGTLAPYLNLTILVGTGTTGTGGSFASCTGFSSTGTIYSGTLADFATNRTDYTSGVTAWDPVGGPETRTFLFRVSVVDTPAAEGLNSTFGFSWETRTS